MATQFDFLLSQIRTADTALIGGKVYFYAAGTTTPKDIYLDRYQTTVAANPYTLSANATAQLYGAGSYRVVIKDAAGSTQFDYDNITASGDDGSLTALDASTDPTVSLPSGGSAAYVKTDDSASTITITPSVPAQTINGLSSYILSVQGETVRLSLAGSTWYVI